MTVGTKKPPVSVKQGTPFGCMPPRESSKDWPSCMQNIGAVARACNCFECETLRVVDPACPITTRSALNAAMGGQRLLWKTEERASVAEAVSDCTYSVAFARWTEGEDTDDCTAMYGV